MLSRIFIQNFALIQELEIDLTAGLQVITGETGAGKSIILGALRLILGERADVKSQTQAGKSVVEATFRIGDNFKVFFDENDLDFEPETIVRREISATGKSRAFINDVPVNLDLLRSLTTSLVDIHSQFETSNLFSEAYQFNMLDGVAGNAALLKDYQAKFSEYNALSREISKLKEQLASGNREADYKNFLLSELLEAELDSLDPEQLESQLNTQENAGAISEHLFNALSAFSREETGILDSLTEAKNRLTKVAELSGHFTELQQRFDETYFELKDIFSEIQDEAENLETDPALLEELNAKLSRLNDLLMKHQVKTLPELIEIRDRLELEQNNFAGLEEEIDLAEKKLEKTADELEVFAKNISAQRKKAAPDFSKRIEKLLKQLGLEKAKIQVDLHSGDTFNAFGSDKIAILFQANTGFPLKPIQTAISGGERSRVMLAVKKIMAETHELPTLILDEIDTGVSGRVADEMGKVMHEMASKMQLVVITHLAQVAAKGDANYKVIKSEVAGKTQTTILPLSTDEKLNEIAQLLSGSRITEAALTQAKELMTV